MRRPKIKRPPLGRQLLSNLAESSEGLSETSGGPLSITSASSNLGKSEVDPPNGLHRASLVTMKVCQQVWYREGRHPAYCSGLAEACR